MSELQKMVAKSIQILKDFQPENENYDVCYSGGKDSDCIRILCELAGVKYDLVHNHTTADAPETVYYVRSIPNVTIEHAYYKDGSPKTMWNLIVKKKYPPTRIARYCCAHLKEVGGVGRLKVTGVRAYESKNRADNSGLVTFKSRPISTVNDTDAGLSKCRTTLPNLLVVYSDSFKTERASFTVDIGRDLNVTKPLLSALFFDS